MVCPLHYISDIFQKPISNFISEISTAKRCIVFCVSASGETPHACRTCQKRFTLKSDLANHQKLHMSMKDPTGMHNFKCRVCGKEGFQRFSEFRRHRLRAHKHVPYGQEKDKAFACGVCGKPHFLRIKAAICAILRHDPERVGTKMFRHKCPECPTETFGYHNLAYLRRHWEAEHADKFLPTHLRKNMYFDKGTKDELPVYFIDKGKADEITRNGIPDTVVKTETPLFIELELLPGHEGRVAEKSEKRSKLGVSNPETLECCGRKYAAVSSFKRHLRTIHESSKVDSRVNLTPFSIGQGDGEPDAITLIKQESCETADPGMKPVCSVNIHDERAVQKLLNFKTLKIKLISLAKIAPANE